MANGNQVISELWNSAVKQASQQKQYISPVAMYTRILLDMLVETTSDGTKEELVKNIGELLQVPKYKGKPKVVKEES